MLTNKEYVAKGGTVCPKCDGEDINADMLEVSADTDVAYANVWCANCKAEWTDRFVLTGYSDFVIDK